MIQIQGNEITHDSSRQNCVASSSRSRVRSRAKVRWTKHDDHRLLTAVEQHGNEDWVLLSQFVPGRTGTQCLQRWKKVGS